MATLVLVALLALAAKVTPVALNATAGGLHDAAIPVRDAAVRYRYYLGSVNASTHEPPTTFAMCMAAGADLAAAAAAGASKPCTSSVCAAEGEAGARAAAQLTARPDDVQCIELVLPRCCEMGSPLEHRQLTLGRDPQSSASLTWIYDILAAFPRVVVTVYYKCAWCFPSALVPELDKDARAVYERQKRSRGESDNGVVSLCPPPPDRAGMFGVAGCRSRLREVAAFDTCSTGNTKEIGAYMNHVLLRRNSLADQTIFVHGIPGVHFLQYERHTMKTFVTALLYTHQIPPPPPVPFLHLNMQMNKPDHGYRHWRPRQGIKDWWRAVFNGENFDANRTDLSSYVAAQFMVSRAAILRRPREAYLGVLGMMGCKLLPVTKPLKCFTCDDDDVTARWPQIHEKGVTKYDGVAEQAWGFVFGAGVQEEGSRARVPKYEDDAALARFRTVGFPRSVTRAAECERAKLKGEGMMRC